MTETFQLKPAEGGRVGTIEYDVTVHVPPKTAERLEESDDEAVRRTIETALRDLVSSGSEQKEKEISEAQDELRQMILD